MSLIMSTHSYSLNVFPCNISSCVHIHTHTCTHSLSLSEYIQRRNCMCNYLQCLNEHETIPNNSPPMLLPINHQQRHSVPDNPGSYLSPVEVREDISAHILLIVITPQWRITQPDHFVSLRVWLISFCLCVSACIFSWFWFLCSEKINDADKIALLPDVFLLGIFQYTTWLWYKNH